MDQNKNLKYDIIEQINFARTKPSEFANILSGYIQYYKAKVFRYPGMTGIQTNEGVDGVNEAIEFLKNQKPVNSLDINSDMNSIASDSLGSILKCKSFDEMEDADLDQLIDKYGMVSGSFAQSVEFGTSVPQMLVANLIIDDGDKARGNRANIFKENFKIVGVDHGNHTQFRAATVIIYCQTFYSKGHDKYKEYADAEEKAVTNVNSNTRRPSRTVVIPKDEGSNPDEITDDDFTDGVVKVAKEIEIIEKGKKKTKIITTIKTMHDGAVIREKKSYAM